jgi:hypothetical protein
MGDGLEKKLDGKSAEKPQIVGLALPPLGIAPIIENSRIHDINRTAYASVAIYGSVNR